MINIIIDFLNNEYIVQKGDLRATFKTEEEIKTKKLKKVF